MRWLSGVWTIVSLLGCVCAASPAASAETAGSVRLSFAPYTSISARRAETLRLVRAGQFDRAESLLTPLQQAYERNEVDEFAVGTAFAPFSTSDEAVGAALERWVAQAPNNAVARLAHARYLRMRFYCLLTAERTKAEMAIGGKRVAEVGFRSIAEYKAALALNPRLMVGWADLVEIAGALRDGSLARDSYASALAVAPASWLVRDAWVRAGGVSAEQYAAFLADAARYEKQNPLLLQLPSDVAVQKAMRLWREGQHAPALAILDAQARTLDVFAIHKYRAWLLRVMERFPESAAAVDHALALMPGKADGYAERAWLHVETKRWAEAAADFRRGVELDPLDVEMNRGLGYALEETGDTRGALAAYTLSARWKAEAETFRKIARLELHKAANAKASLAASERAVALEPENKWAWLIHAEALDALGHPRARESYTRFLALADPKSEYDRRYIAYAKSRNRPGVKPLVPEPPAPPASPEP